MNPEILFSMVQAMPSHDAQRAARQMRPAGMKRVTDKTLHFSGRHRGQWFKPDFNLREIHIARKTDGFIFKSTQKKVNRVMVAGWEIVGNNPEPRDYVVRRLLEMAWASQTVLDQVVEQTFTQLFSISNCAWIKKRSVDLSSGSIRRQFDRELEPVAAYFIVDFDTLELKTKRNGEPKKWRQIDHVTGETKEFFPHDVVHFRTNQDPGYSIGFPELHPALDDIALLRRIEENVEDLIDANLFPVFHYKVGSDTFPETWGPDGRKETDIVKNTIEYMPAGGIYVSDHRHEIEAVGSEGRALRIESYLSYFKSRALASLGTTAIDMGEGDTANRSTASTLSKGTLGDVEAMTKVFKRYFDFFIINELLLEGGFDPLDPENKVEIKFGVIDKEERRADENQEIQFWLNNIHTIDEVRKNLGDEPFVDEMSERTFFSMYQEQLELVKAGGPGSAAHEALAEHPGSSITPQGVAKEKQFAEKQEKLRKQAGPQGRPATKKSGTVANRSRPANQHGKRASAKTTRDIVFMDGCTYSITCDTDIEAATLDAWKAKVHSRWEMVADHGVGLEAVIYNLLPQLENT